jgi:hypothetical protein
VLFNLKRCQEVRGIIFAHPESGSNSKSWPHIIICLLWQNRGSNPTREPVMGLGRLIEPTHCRLSAWDAPASTDDLARAAHCSDSHRTIFVWLWMLSFV